MRPRFFSCRRDSVQVRVYRAATAWFLLVAGAMVWPVYPLFARVRPLVLGVPAGLAWLAGLMGLSFAAALALFVWETRRNLIDVPVAETDDRRAVAPSDRGAGDA